MHSDSDSTAIRTQIVTQVQTVTRIQIVTQMQTVIQIQTVTQTQIVTIQEVTQIQIVIQTLIQVQVRGSHTGKNLVILKEIQIDLLKVIRITPKGLNTINKSNNINHNILISGDGAPYKRQQNIINSSSGHRNQNNINQFIWNKMAF